MRKYRGIATNQKGFIYGEVVIEKRRAFIKCRPAFEEPTGRLGGFITVREETISQFTGLFDSEGKEIYEGDYYREDDNVFICAWIQERCMYGWLTPAEIEILKNENLEAAIGDDEVGLEIKDCKRIKVVGNIFQKPEVLQL